MRPTHTGRTPVLPAVPARVDSLREFTGSEHNRTGERIKWVGDVTTGMGDTKRGRERKGTIKREQRLEREVYRELNASEEPPESEDEELEIGS